MFSLLSRLHCKTNKQKNKNPLLWLKLLSAAVSLFDTTIHHWLSICCIFCFSPACQKGLLVVRKHDEYLRAVQKAGTCVLLSQTKCAKLSRCTSLDRVMFRVCAWLKSCWTVCNVVMPDGCLLDDDSRFLSLTFALVHYVCKENINISIKAVTQKILTHISSTPPLMSCLVYSVAQ